MKAIITGGTGFAGSHLSELFLKGGHSVLFLDNFIIGHTENINRFKINTNFVLVNTDVSEKDVLEENIIIL